MIIKTSLRFANRRELDKAVAGRLEVEAPARYRQALIERRLAVLRSLWNDPESDGPRVDLKVRVGRRWRFAKADIRWSSSGPTLALGTFVVPDDVYGDLDATWVAG